MGAVAVMIVTLWLPWHHSGERPRNAFALLATADRLDVGPGALRAVWRWLVPTIPAVAAIAWLALLFGNRRAYLLASAAVAFVVGSVAVVAIGVSGASLMGPGIALVGSATAIISLAAGVWARKGRPMGRRDRSGGAPDSREAP